MQTRLPAYFVITRSLLERTSKNELITWISRDMESGMSLLTTSFRSEVVTSRLMMSNIFLRIWRIWSGKIKPFVIINLNKNTKLKAGVLLLNCCKFENKFYWINFICLINKNYLIFWNLKHFKIESAPWILSPTLSSCKQTDSEEPTSLTTLRSRPRGARTENLNSRLRPRSLGTGSNPKEGPWTF